MKNSLCKQFELHQADIKEDIKDLAKKVGEFLYEDLDDVKECGVMNYRRDIAIDCFQRGLKNFFKGFDPSISLMVSLLFDREWVCESLMKMLDDDSVDFESLKGFTEIFSYLEKNITGNELDKFFLQIEGVN